MSDIDVGGLDEFSVVYTNRSLNHMSKNFCRVMCDIHEQLCAVYNAQDLVLVPGGGSYGMEAVVRQFAINKRVMIVRNGWFSYRWTQIIAQGNFGNEPIVLKAKQAQDSTKAAFAPVPIDEVEAKIASQKPEILFVPHVETSSGIILPDEYLARVCAAVHKVGGIVAVDCIASGAIWLDMEKTGIDILLSAPQKGWSSSPCAGIVLLGERALKILPDTQSDSFVCDLKKWQQIMHAYLGGGHAYHATMPTDSLRGFRDTIMETKSLGFDFLRDQQWELGKRVRKIITDRDYPSVAADGFQAPSVVVSFCDDVDMHNGKKFGQNGVQIAAGVPLQCDEREDFRTFRIGLFGIDKLQDIDGTCERWLAALDKVRTG